MQQQHTDGGPAFPGISSSILEDTAHGMTLRDYFAAQALHMFDTASLKAAHEEAHHSGVEPSSIVAAFAYDIADAMLRARAAQSPAESTPVDAVRLAFVAGWDAHRDQMTESGPSSSLVDEWQSYRAKSPADVQRAHLDEFGK